jgi:type II restriction enzyme
MATSAQLRKIQAGQKNIFNKSAKSQEKPVKRASEDIISKLIKKGEAVEYVEKILKTDFKKFCRNQQSIGTNISNKKSCIRPDGGFILLTHKNMRFIILASEAKKQGTNKERQSEGKKKQSQGNAVERAVKNYEEICLLTDGYEITPYSIFIYGCDFEIGSSIRDRITSMTRMRKFNKIYLQDLKVKDDGFRKSASVFVRECEWDYKTIYSVNMRIATRSIEHIKQRF